MFGWGRSNGTLEISEEVYRELITALANANQGLANMSETILRLERAVKVLNDQQMRIQGRLEAHMERSGPVTVYTGDQNINDGVGQMGQNKSNNNN